MARAPGITDFSCTPPRPTPYDEPVTTALPPARPTTASAPAVRTALAFGEALLAVALAGVLSWALRDFLSATRLLLFWVSSAYAAWRGGYGPALMASVLGIVIANFTTTGPAGEFTMPTMSEVFSALVLLFVTGLLGATFDRLRAALAEALDTAQQLAHASEQLQDQAVELEHQLEESQVMAEELEQANEQLGDLSADNARARAQLEQAVNGMSDAMLVFDRGGRLVFHNQAAADLLHRVGKDVNAMHKRVVWEELPFLEPGRTGLALRDAAARREAIERDLRYQPANLWLRVRGVPAPDGSLTAFIHDRTLARDAEIARARSEERYRALIEASTAAVWIADPKGAVEDRPVWRELTGQSEH